MFDWFVLLTPLLLLPVVLLLVFVGCPLSHPALRADRFSLTFDTALVRIATVLFEFSLRRPDGGMNGPQIINVPVDDPTRPLDGVFFGGVRGELTRFIGSTRQKCGIVERRIWLRGQAPWREAGAVCGPSSVPHSFNFG